jgi:peptidoglycan hydrolase-like protein with peptidoglycan-binding domain
MLAGGLCVCPALQVAGAQTSSTTPTKSTATAQSTTTGKPTTASPAKKPVTPTKPGATSTSAKKKSTAATHNVKTRMQMAPTPDRIREIQTALVASDSYKGTPTGKWDPETIDAMKHFQQLNGLNPTGKLDALSLQKLGLGSDTAGRGAPRLAKPAGTPTSSTTPTIQR